jgi:hypothetical protein
MSLDSEEIHKAMDGAVKDMLLYGTGAIFLTMGNHGVPQVKHVPFKELRVKGKPKVWCGGSRAGKGERNAKA